jgi:hypothetical protein
VRVCWRGEACQEGAGDRYLHGAVEVILDDVRHAAMGCDCCCRVEAWGYQHREGGDRTDGPTMKDLGMSVRV